MNFLRYVNLSLKDTVRDWRDKLNGYLSTMSSHIYQKETDDSEINGPLIIENDTTRRDENGNVISDDSLPDIIMVGDTKIDGGLTADSFRTSDGKPMNTSVKNLVRINKFSGSGVISSCNNTVLFDDVTVDSKSLSDYDGLSFVALFVPDKTIKINNETYITIKCDGGDLRGKIGNLSDGETIEITSTTPYYLTYTYDSNNEVGVWQLIKTTFNIDIEDIKTDTSRTSDSDFYPVVCWNGSKFVCFSFVSVNPYIKTLRVAGNIEAQSVDATLKTKSVKTS